MLPVLAIAVGYLDRVRPDAVEPLVNALDRIGAREFKEIAMNTYEQAIETGERRGEKRGEKRGLEQGLSNERAVLLRLCAKRFGVLPLDAQARIQAADHETLLRWADSFVDAKVLDEVFGDTGL